MSERVIKISWKENEVTINDDVVVFGFGWPGPCTVELWSSCARAIWTLVWSFILSAFIIVPFQGQGKCVLSFVEI